MKVLVVGQGGREHALVWKLSQSPTVTQVFCAPGNAGTASDGQNVAIPEHDHLQLMQFCLKQAIDLVVVGPEAPLVAGLSDYLRQHRIRVFGPTQQAAMLEGSKIFCKQMLKDAGIPTADSEIFEKFEDVQRYLEAFPRPCVVKADGLAAGKGVVVCDRPEEALAAARRMLIDDEFGAAGRRLMIEERLDGPEASVLAITDGSTIAILPTCQDHKRAFDGDRGPNTGGMGAYSPNQLIKPDELTFIEDRVFVPIVHQMRRGKRPFQGVLFAGLMLTARGPKVLEFNVRFGDPECQAILMRLKSDLGAVLTAAADGRLKEVALEWDDRPSVCVVLASGGYPGAYRKGLPIRGLDQVPGSPTLKVFHAGTKVEGDRIVTAGGRVLGVTALGATIADAKQAADAAVQQIEFTGAQFRTDIAYQAI